MTDPSTPKRILVADVQVPFVHGGAELHVRALIEQLGRRGHAVERVALPFRSQPKSELLAQAAAWRLLDLASANSLPIDLLIATRFPTYFARHPRKVAWVIHQHRAAYELCGTAYSDFDHTESDVGLRQQILALDRRMLGECRHVYANARNTANRLAQFNGITAAALYHPPPLADRLRPDTADDYLLVVGRLEPIKRVDLAIRALALIPPPTRLVVVGEGSERARLARLAADLGLAARVTLTGLASDESLVRFYARALGVIYTPFDEDFGYVTLESFLCAKPVITATDSGGPLEFVVDGENGFICAPEPEAIAGAARRLTTDRALASRLGHAGHAVACAITWDGVVEQLLA